MIPSVLSQQLRQGVEDFLRTTFPVSTPFFHGIIDRLLAEDEGVFKGPYLSIQLPFRGCQFKAGQPVNAISYERGRNNFPT